MSHAAHCNHSYHRSANHSFGVVCNDDYMETLEQRIKRLREERDLSQQKVADTVGVSRVAVTKWESGETANIKLGNLLKLCDLFCISVEELVRGSQGRQKLTQDPLEKAKAGAEAFKKFIKKGGDDVDNEMDKSGLVRVIDGESTRVTDSMPLGFLKFELHPIQVSAGPGAVANTYGQDEIEFIEVAEWWARKYVGSTDTDRIKVVPCRGSSMSPTIPEGSLLFVDVETKRHIGDGIYCIDLDNRLLVKRINVRQKDRVFEVVSDNKNGPDTETYPLSEQDRMCICGKVVAWLAVQKDG